MNTIITSTANPQIKAIRHLFDRKGRQETGLFFIEGLRIVGEAFQKKLQPETLIVCRELLVSDFGVRLAAEFEKQGGNLLEVSEVVFRAISVKDGPQGIAAVLKQNWLPLDQVTVAADDFWIALDSVADPGNLGTILRTGDAVGCRGIILLDHCTDPYDPGAMRSSMGAIFDLSLVRCSFEEFTKWKTETGITVVGTSDASKVDYQSYRYPRPIVLMMGSERQGMQPRVMALCDEVVSIPMCGGSDSLNLAVATGVTAYEILNQARKGGAK